MNSNSDRMGAASQRHLNSSGIINEKQNYACVPIFAGSNNNCSEKCCLSYRLQSHCIDNRHFHAWIQKYGRASCLHILDLTHKKSSKTWIQDDAELDFLPSKIVGNSELQMCNVVGFHKDLVVTQIFCQGAVKFIITGMNDGECKIIYNKRYLQQQKLQLYSCYISPDENYMVLHQNSIYATMYAHETENIEGVILVKLNWKSMTAETISCENLNLHVLPSNHKFAITFDPRTDSDLTVFTFIAGADRCNISLYKMKKDNVLFQIALFKNELADLPGNFQNLQFFRDGSALLLTVLGSNSCMPTIIRNHFVTAHFLDPECYDFLGDFKYMSLTSVEHFTPMISASGRHCFCGGKLYNVQKIKPKSYSLKTLKQSCLDVIADSVLIEDLCQLPLPKSLIACLEQGKS
ncbi:Hypothetical predicted protein [Mytilus galloprovincialis]|uniref:SOCS box domain-containing protein n=2 Tax=Mytilus galloprovincialis TaxID=29158 RepID=A0A8B6GB05_MYTGA|nr:Hypothetical predicted protein [Mytilus galloprovincialis]